jgi:predicted phage terminase large subunit-like protein
LPGDDLRDVEIKNAHYRQRVSSKWGLVERVRQTALRFKADALIIENAASGRTTADELRRLYANDPFAVYLEPPKGDKVARAKAVQPIFAQKMVFAPNRTWADMVIRQMSQFPHGKRKDLTDTASQALSWLRKIGRLRTDEERRLAQAAAVKHHGHRQALYPV